MKVGNKTEMPAKIIECGLISIILMKREEFNNSRLLNMFEASLSHLICGLEIMNESTIEGKKKKINDSIVDACFVWISDYYCFFIFFYFYK